MANIMRHLISIARCSFVLLTGTLLLLSPTLGCNKQDSIEREPLIRPVRVVQIAEAGANMKQTLAGVARASKEMALSFRVSGTLNQLKIKRGDKVKRGDLIASLDSKDARIEIQRAQASVARATAEHRSAQADFERAKSLYAEGSASRSDLDASRALADSSRAMLSAENETLAMARSKLADHTLKAPLPGGIADVDVEVNENVQSGQRVALLNAGEKVEVEVAVPERIIELFRKGATTEVRFDSIRGEVFEGVISEVGLASTEGAVGFPIRVALLKADKRIRAGIAALVTLSLANSDDAQRIFAPPQALLEDNLGQRYVLVARPTEGGFAQVARLNVAVGEPSTLGVAIKSGLNGGEKVIVAGLAQISVGMKVRLLTADQPPLANKRLNRPADGAPLEVPVQLEDGSIEKDAHADDPGVTKP